MRANIKYQWRGAFHKSRFCRQIPQEARADTQTGRVAYIKSGQFTGAINVSYSIQINIGQRNRAKPLSINIQNHLTVTKYGFQIEIGAISQCVRKWMFD